MLGTLLCMCGVVEFFIGIYTKIFKTNAFIRFLMITQIFTLGVKKVEINDQNGFKGYISASFALGGAFYIALGAAEIRYDLNFIVIIIIIIITELLIFRIINNGMKQYFKK